MISFWSCNDLLSFYALFSHIIFALEMAFHLTCTSQELPLLRRHCERRVNFHKAWHIKSPQVPASPLWQQFSLETSCLCCNYSAVDSWNIIVTECLNKWTTAQMERRRCESFLLLRISQHLWRETWRSGHHSVLLQLFKPVFLLTLFPL